MKNITIKLTEEEYNAIQGYSQITKENIEELAKKILINNITFLNHEVYPDKKYVYEFKFPENLSQKDTEKFIIEHVNKIRMKLGMKPIIL